MHKFVRRALESKSPSLIFDAIEKAKSEEEIEMLCDAMCKLNTKGAAIHMSYFATKLKTLKKEKLIRNPKAEDLKAKLCNAVVASQDALSMFWFARDVEGADIESLRRGVVLYGDKYVVEDFYKIFPCDASNYEYEDCDIASLDTEFYGFEKDLEELVSQECQVER